MLRKNERLNGHLLSTFNKPSDEPQAQREVEPQAEKDPVVKEEIDNTSDTELSSLSSDALDELQDDTGYLVQGEARGELDEAAINAPPASSSEDDSSDSDALPRSPEVKKETLQERLAEADRKKSSSSASGWGGSRGSQNRSLSSRKGNLTRTSSNVAANDSDPDDPFSSFAQSQKRPRTKKSVYGKSKSFSGPPSSSARKQSQDIKSDSEEEKPKKEDSPSEETKPELVFKKPREIDFDSVRKAKSEGEESEFKGSFESTSGSSLETLASSGAQADTAATSPAVPDEPTPPSLCPWCHKEVDPGLLVLFEAQPRQRIREQQQFCKSHQQDTAEREWAARNYPDIDWDSFDERVQKHFSDLERVLVPDSSSYFRNILDESLKKGKAKNFRLTLAGDGLETMSCGYYGTRGAAKM